METKQENGAKAATRSARQYSRKWKVTIYKKMERDTTHSIAVDVSLLRCVFTVESVYGTPVTVCTLEIYNLNEASEGEIIREGFQVSIEAGYEEGQYGEIFTGDIVQIIRNREKGIDYRLEILALRGSDDLTLNYTISSIAAGSTPRDTINAIARNAKRPIIIGEISPNLSQQALPRGKVLFGTPSQYLRDLAIGNDAYYWAGEDGKLVVKKTQDEIPADQVLVLSPGDPNKDKNDKAYYGTGLVGTPQYSDDGIHLQMLLDSRVKLNTLVNIDNEWIRRSLISLNAGGKASPQKDQFDKDGEYQVIKLTHRGDTHRDIWITEVIGLGRHGRSGPLIAQAER